MLRLVLLGLLFVLTSPAIAQVGTIVHDGPTVTVGNSGSAVGSLGFTITTATANEVVLVGAVSPTGHRVVSFDGSGAGAFIGWFPVSINDDGRCCVSVWEAVVPTAGTSTFTCHVIGSTIGWTIVADAYESVKAIAPIDGFLNLDVGGTAILGWPSDVIPNTTGDLVCEYIASVLPTPTLSVGVGATVLGKVNGTVFEIADVENTVAGVAGVDSITALVIGNAIGTFNGTCVVVVLRPSGT